MRNAKGLSQRQLARQAGVTNGLISMIEQGRSSPSIASLKRILDAVPMTFSEFFADDGPSVETFVHRAEDLREISLGAVLDLREAAADLLSLRQVGDASRHKIQMLHEVYAPGADTGPELYTHPGEEAGIVIEGQIALTVIARTEVLGPGDAYLFESNKPHRFHNNFTKRCVIVSACTPPSF
ncbi:MAG: cupin domain-containing protein [Rhodobacterales bacterium]